MHTVNDEIYEVVIEPLALPDKACFLKTETLGNRPAAHILARAANLNLDEMQGMKGVINHIAASPRHDAPALKSCTQPVANLDCAPLPVDVVKADTACQLSPIPDAT